MIDAQCGGGLSTNAKARVQVLANLAARRIYDASKYWERYLVFGEPRTISRGFIPYSEDSFYVYGAGTEGVNGLYVRNGTINGKAAYRLYDSDGTTELYSIEWDNSSDWQLLDVSDAVIYDITDSSATPPTSGWAVNTGTAPAPLLADVADIETVFDVTTNGAPLVSDSFNRKKFLCSDKGIEILDNNYDATQAYVTYKKKLSDTYGDGTGGTVSDIPAEFFDYMALYASRQFQISNRQGNSSPYAVIASREVDEALADQLQRIEDQNVEESIGRRIMTHLSTNNSLY